LFNASAQTLLEVAANPKHLGAELGLIGILHTWGHPAASDPQPGNLLLHPHVDCAIPAGGLSPDHSRWVRPRYPFFLPVKVLSQVFRGKFCAGLKRLYRRQRLRCAGPASTWADRKQFHRLLRRLHRQDWVVYAKPAFGGPTQVLRYRFWTKHTGQPPAELVFDSQLTTYQKFSELNREGICFITLRRRSEKMLREIYSQPDSAWLRISLPALTRIYRNPKVLETRVTLSGYEGELRQLTIMELGHEEPTVLLTNHRKLGPIELVTRYAQRMLIENGISEAVQFFHINALSSMVGMKVDFDMQLTLAASSLYRMMAQRIGREIQPPPGQNCLSQSVGSVRQSGGHGNLGCGDPGQARTQSLSGRLRSGRSAHTEALVRR
jgi:hypothetical protein